jgi:DNA-binding transcriptional MerR regulator
VSATGLPIGQVARRAGVGIQTVRYYERRGLLPRPARRPSGQREYDAQTVDLLRTVKQAQRVGFTLAEIEELLRLADDRAGGAQHLRDRLRAKIVEIDGRISALAQMRASLEAALHAGCDALTRCTDEDCPFWTAPATPAPERPERSHPGSGSLD